MKIYINPVLAKNITGFGYRQAVVEDCIVSIKTDTNDYEEYNNLHNRLARRANVKPDNHQLFYMELENKHLVIQFSDEYIYIGTDYRLGIW